MSDSNRKSIWNYLRVLNTLVERYKSVWKIQRENEFQARFFQ
jgi:hypothetical protein